MMNCHAAEARVSREVAAYIADCDSFARMCVGGTTNIIKYKATIAGTRVEDVASHRLDIDRFASLGAQNATSDIAYSQATIARRYGRGRRLYC